VPSEQATFRAWRSVLKAIFGLPMSDDEAAIYRACTGRSELPDGAFNIAWLVVGRRGGISGAV
jgi:hypothetical protein